MTKANSSLALRCTAAGGASKGLHPQSRSILRDASRLPRLKAGVAPQHEDCI
jgi:hypothetical protein